MRVVGDGQKGEAGSVVGGSRGGAGDAARSGEQRGADADTAGCSASERVAGDEGEAGWEEAEPRGACRGVCGVQGSTRTGRRGAGAERGVQGAAVTADGGSVGGCRGAVGREERARVPRRSIAHGTRRGRGSHAGRVSHHRDHGKGIMGCQIQMTRAEERSSAGRRLRLKSLVRCICHSLSQMPSHITRGKLRLGRTLKGTDVSMSGAYARACYTLLLLLPLRTEIRGRDH